MRERLAQDRKELDRLFRHIYKLHLQLRRAHQVIHYHYDQPIRYVGSSSDYVGITSVDAMAAVRLVPCEQLMASTNFISNSGKPEVDAEQATGVQ